MVGRNGNHWGKPCRWFNREQGRLLLFEKTNPEYPYQATKFQNLNEVKEYMINQLNSTYEDGAGEVAVMKNDIPM